MTLDRSRFVPVDPAQPAYAAAPGSDAPPRQSSPPIPVNGYGEGRRRWPALAFVVLLHGALVVLVLTAHMTLQRTPRAERLTVFDVASDPAPPERPPEPQPQPLALEIPQPRTHVAPRPIIELPAVRPAAVTPTPQTVRASVPSIDAPAAPAPPAPITPPDFNAAQLANPGPSYPYRSRRNREEGVVLLRVFVTEAGRAGEIRIEESSGFGRLDQAALDTVRRWRFLPARQAGEPVAAWVLVPITFALS